MKIYFKNFQGFNVLQELGGNQKQSDAFWIILDSSTPCVTFVDIFWP